MGRRTAKPYSDDIRMLRSILIVTSLQQKLDIEANKSIAKFDQHLSWKPLSSLMIDEAAWQYVVENLKHDAKFVFCHPEILIELPETSLYYRGLCALSLKATKDYFPSIESLERGRKKTFKRDDLICLAQIYNTFICSIIRNSTKWTLENGRRTIIATLGITLDGVMRNRIGAIAERKVRAMVVEWLQLNKLITSPKLTTEDLRGELPVSFRLKGNIDMEFSSEPDISFWQRDGRGRKLLAIVEIKGGIDPAGTLERYGAAQKSFRSAQNSNPKCKNFFLSAVFTKELSKRIDKDRLVDHAFDIVKLLNDKSEQSRFSSELFHHTLRLV